MSKIAPHSGQVQSKQEWLQFSVLSVHGRYKNLSELVNRAASHCLLSTHMHYRGCIILKTCLLWICLFILCFYGTDQVS
jgi:hypothetical protein